MYLYTHSIRYLLNVAYIHNAHMKGKQTVPQVCRYVWEKMIHQPLTLSWIVDTLRNGGVEFHQLEGRVSPIILQ